MDSEGLTDRNGDKTEKGGIFNGGEKMMEEKYPNRRNSILVADDSDFIARLMTKMLEGTPFRVAAHAKNGEEAIQKYIEIFPEIVTMDIVMPQMGGIEAIRELIKLNPRIKLIVVSAMGHEKIVEEAMRLGAKHYLVKPFLRNAFVSALETLAEPVLEGVA
jgi:two-component system, chemotaxis family, chemotaxis protein CheY